MNEKKLIKQDEATLPELFTKINEKVEEVSNIQKTPSTNPLPNMTERIEPTIADIALSEIEEFNIVAGLTTPQRKMLVGILLNFTDKKNQTDKEIAKSVGVSVTSFYNFRHNPRCITALSVCMRLAVRGITDRLLAKLWEHGDYSYQAIVALLKYTHEYIPASESRNANININAGMDMQGNAQDPRSVMKTIVTKLGAIGFSQERVVQLARETYIEAQIEGAF